jgi:hypothetical protein
MIAKILKDNLLKIRLSMFVDFDDLTLGEKFEETINEEIKIAKLIIILWSIKSAASMWVKRELQLALEAWEDNRLILVWMDDAELPFGLRDLQTIQIPPESLLEETATAIAHEARRRLRQTPPAPSAPKLRRVAVAPAATSKIILATFFLLMIGIGLGSWLVMAPTLESPPPAPSESPTPMPGPPPGPWRPEASIPAIDTVEMIAGLIVIIVVAVPILMLANGFLWGRHSIPRRAATPAQMQNKEQHGDAGPPPQGAIFVSYSRDDGPKVTIIVDELERSGLRTWIDTRRESDAQRFARPIVQAIRTSKACAFMCSPTAYRSDHVVRELYLADKYGKPMIPVEIEPDALPEDFEYFSREWT